MDNGSPSKRRRLSSFTSESTADPYYSGRSDSIDVTGDSPPPAIKNTNSMTVTNDEAFARQLQARYDAEAFDSNLASPRSKASSSRHRSQETASGDKASARQSKAHTNGEGSALRRSSNTKTTSLVTSTPHEIDRSSPTLPSSLGTNVQTSQNVSPQEIQKCVRAHYLKVSNHKCPRCAKKYFAGEANILSVFAALTKPEWSTEQGIPCPGCGAVSWPVNDSNTSMWVLLCGFDHNSQHNKPAQKRSARPKHALTRRHGSGTGYDSSPLNYEDEAQHDTQDETQQLIALTLSKLSVQDNLPLPNSMPGTNIIPWWNNTPGSNIMPWSNNMPGSNTMPGSHLERIAGEPPSPQPSWPTADDKMTERVLVLLTSLLSRTMKSNSPSDRMPFHLLGSSILDRAAELFRNNDIADVTSSATLYLSLARFTRALAEHPATNALVSAERVVRTPGASIMQISLGTGNLVKTAQYDTSQSLVNCMRDLSTQCSTMLRSSASATNERHLATFRAIKDLYAFLKSAAGPPDSLDKESWQKDLMVSEVADREIMPKHSFAALELIFSPPKRMTRIMQELAILQTSLPNGIFVRYASSRPDIMKILITGPRDTPYENGLFEFDLFCDERFPHAPPRMNFRTTAGGMISFNPNLYPDGTICLSLLGTWEGEQWNSKSTLLQVLISIQSMILCEKPWYNEPGRQRRTDVDQASKTYNQSLYHRTVQHAMLDWLDRRRYPAGIPRHPRTNGPMRGFDDKSMGGTIDQSKDVWDDVVKKHFSSCEQEILQTVKKWMAEIPQASTERLRRGVSAPFLSPSIPPHLQEGLSPLPPVPSHQHPGSSNQSGLQSPITSPPWMVSPSSLVPQPSNGSPAGLSSAASFPSPLHAFQPGTPGFPSLAHPHPSTANPPTNPLVNRSRPRKPSAKKMQEIPELKGKDFAAKLLQAAQFLKEVGPRRRHLGAMHGW